MKTELTKVLKPKVGTKRGDKTQQWINESTKVFASYTDEAKNVDDVMGIYAMDSSGNTLPINEFLKKQYELHLKEFDDIGEYIRSMDYLLPMCHEGLMDANKKFDHVKSYAPEEMLVTYYKNLENLGMMSKKIQEAARKIKAIDIENYMAELCGNAFKSAWMIKATLRKG